MHLRWGHPGFERAALKSPKLSFGAERRQKGEGDEHEAWVQRRIYKPGVRPALEEVRFPQSLRRERGPANTPTAEPSHPLLSHCRTPAPIALDLPSLTSATEYFPFPFNYPDASQAQNFSVSLILH